MPPTLQAAPPVELRNVSHLYGQTVVSKHLDITLRAGRVYLLLGPNGSGKSTLLRILAGLLRPSFGQVRLWGQSPEQVRERIGFMSHAPMLYDEFTGRENLRYSAALYAPAICLSPEQAMESAGLDPVLRQPVRAYSQGMRQRLSLARVLLPRPDLLLLDEPFSNMDATSAQAMLALLGRERDRGCTIVLTTHQRELAAPLADKVLLMANGELQEGE